MKVLGYIFAFIILLIGGCTYLGASAVKGMTTAVMDMAEAEAHATLVAQYQRHRTRGLKSIRKNTNFCMQPRLDPNLPDTFLIDYNDIQEQKIIAQAAGTSEAEQAAMVFKQQKLAHMSYAGKSLPSRQKRALKRAIRDFDVSNSMTQFCIAQKVNEELGEISKKKRFRSASNHTKNTAPTRTIAPKPMPKKQPPKLRGSAQ